MLSIHANAQDKTSTADTPMLSLPSPVMGMGKSTIIRRANEETVILDINSDDIKAFARLIFITCAGQPINRIEFLTKRVTTLGRNPQSDIFIDDRIVSRCHLRIYCEDGKLLIEDNNSTNQTKMNNITLNPSEKTIVPNNAIIEIGQTSFEIEILR